MIMKVMSVALSIAPARRAAPRARRSRGSASATDVPIISVIGCESEAMRVMRTIPDE